MVGLRGLWTRLRAPFSDERRAFTRHPSARERRAIRAELVAALDSAALGIGLPLDYMTQGVGEAELRMIFELAAERSAPIFVHVRRGIAGAALGILHTLPEDPRARRIRAALRSR